MLAMPPTIWMGSRSGKSLLIFFELDERLQRLAQDERFQTENALFRLQIPTGEPLSELWSDNESDLQALLDNPFVPEPGASILALDLQFRPEF
jgi:hypothetical protein